MPLTSGCPSFGPAWFWLRFAETSQRDLLGRYRTVHAKPFVWLGCNITVVVRNGIRSSVMCC